MTASAFTKSALLNVLVRGIPYAGPEQWWVAIWTGNPATTGAEVQAAEYERQQVTFDSAYDSLNELKWAVATSTWGNLEYIVVLDAQTGGNKLGWTAGSGDPIVRGIQPRIALGDLDWSMT